MKLSRLVLLSILLAAGVAASAVADPVVVQIEGGRVGSALHLRAVSSSGAEMELSGALDEQRQMSVPLDLSASWTLSVESEGYWAESTEVLSSPVTIPLWPAATFELTLVPPRATAVPLEATIRLTRADGAFATDRYQPSEAEVSCLPGEKGRAICVGPSGRWDIRVKCAGYVPSYSWDRAVEEGGTMHLGRIPIRPGVSLLGRVVTEEGAADAELANVWARIRVLPDKGSPGVPPEMEKKTLSARLNRWGYFLFDALPSGSYEIVAKQEGFEEASRSVDLGAGQDVEMRDPLVLERPLRLMARIDPPVDPGVGSWTVVVRAARPGGWTEIARGLATEEGEWSSPPISPGSYSVFVENWEGDVLAKAELDLQRGSQLAMLDFDLLRVAGTLWIGEAELAGHLWFGGRHGEVRVRAEADADGEFSLVLPRAGTWKVDVVGESTKVVATGVEVEVAEPRPGKAAEVSIVLPDTEVRGSVRDSENVPVAAARVALVPAGGAAGLALAETDELGAFSIRGQAEGSYSIEASKERASSERRLVLLDEELTPPEIDLVLLERKTLEGSVVAWGSPVAGAWVLGLPMTAGGSLAAMMAAQARTGLDGAFDLELPQNAASVRIITTAPGYTLSVSTIQVTEQATTFTVSLDQEGARLELARPAGGVAGGKQLPLVLVDGQPLDLPLLEIWSKAHDPDPSTGALLVVEGMPQGAYAYCVLGFEEAMAVVGGGAYPAQSACVEGYLAPGGILRLAPPDSASRR